MVRLLLIFIILLLAVFYSSELPWGKNKRKIYIVWISVLLILQSGLRNVAVGPDTYQYYIRFESIKQVSFNEIWNSILNWQGKDPFYNFFQKTFQLFSDNYHIFLLVVAMIFLSALGNFIFKNTNRVSQAAIAYLIYMGYYYGFFSITGIRQTIATAFLLYSIEYIKKKNLPMFILFVLFGSLFHITALVFLPLYFLSKTRKTKLIFAISVLGFPLFMLFKNQLIVFFVDIIGMEERFGFYTHQFKTGSFILTSFQLILAIIALINEDKIRRIMPNSSIMFSAYALAIFYLPLQWVSPSAGRISQYFALVMMVWIPYIIDAISPRNIKQRHALYIFASILFIFITSFSIQWDGYKFFWQPMELPAIYR